MGEINPVAWCLMTEDGVILNGIHEEKRHAESYPHRYASDTLTSLYTADQLAEAVAAERERIFHAHNIREEDDLFWDFDDREYGHDDASELLQANEFEIVHIATGRNTGELFGFSSKHEDHFFKTEAEAVAAVEAIRSAAK